MGKPTGFKEFERQAVPYRDPLERAGDFLEIFTAPADVHLRTQGARCMDCGVPFCQSESGCPIDNLIPEWNDLVYQGRWQRRARPAAQDEQLPRVHRPHLPGPVRRRLRARHHRPAGHDQEHRERDHRPRLRRRLGHAAAARRTAPASAWPSSAAAPPASPPPRSSTRSATRSPSTSGPTASAACLMYGIPNMKLDKGVVQRRVDLLAAEGVEFVTCAHVGRQEDFPAGHMTQIMQERGCPVKFIDPQQAARRFRRGAPRHRRHQVVRSHRPLPRPRA